MQKPRRRWRFFFRFIFFSFSLFLLMGGAGLLWAFSLDLPDFNSIEERKVAESTKIYDRTGETLLYDVNRDLKRTVIPLSAMSRHIKNATVAIEDDTFYAHHGVELRAIFRAAFANILAGRKAQGGSTITQQVVKNTLLTQEKQFTRKIKEIALAIKLEQVLSKDQILELYLNESPYGGSIYGIEEASRAFFGISANDLSLAEAAYLAALPKAPTYYSPYGKQRAELDARKNLVLSRMTALGFISATEADAATKEEVIFVPQAEQTIKAPHFVMYVRSLLEKKYGADVLETGGLKVITTLDWKLEQLAQDIVSRFGAENAKKYNANNAGLVAIDPKTGQVLAMVGSRDYFDASIDGSVNTTITHRQPGSSFKPFVYATAFKKGYTPDTVVFDLPTQFDTTCTAEGVPIGGGDPKRCYAPENYDGLFRGPMKLRDALAQSINIPAIKVLYLAGIKDSIETARALGIRGLEDQNRYGLTLVLGGGEVSLLDMTGAYAVFGNDGVKNQPTPIMKVEDKNGNILEQYASTPTPVLSPQTARQIADILSDNVARTPAYGAASPLLIYGRDVAVKTGTTNDYRDAWIVGFAPNLAVGVWAGNNDNTPMEKKVAGFIVAPLWHEFMTKAVETLPRETFPSPEIVSQTIKPAMRGLWQGGREYVVDKISGKLATDNTPLELRESQVVTDVHTILRWTDKNNPLGPAPVRPENDPQYFLWEIPIQKWLTTRKNIPNHTPPAVYDDVHLPEYAPVLVVNSPKPGSTLSVNDTLQTAVTVSGHFPIEEVQYFLDGAFLGSATRAPWSIRVPLASLETLRPAPTLRVVVYDNVRNRSVAELPLVINIPNEAR